MLFNEEWKNGVDGFLLFVDEVQPVIENDEGQLIKIQFTDFQKDEIRKAFDSECRIVVWCWPRRHSKTIISTLIVMWKFLCFEGQHIGIVANSKDHGIDTAFKLLSSAIENTEFTKNLIGLGEIKSLLDTIRFKRLRNEIKGYPCKRSVLVGKAMSVVQLSEFHENQQDDILGTLTGNNAARKDALMLIDSTASHRGHQLHSLYQKSKEKNSNIFFSYIFYKDVDELREKAPSWAKHGIELQIETADINFEKEWLNKFSAGVRNFMPEKILQRCIDDSYGTLEEIVNGRTYIVGAGLDRATSTHIRSDATVLTFVVKTVIGDRENIFVLDTQRIRNDDNAVLIRDSLKKAYKEWNLQEVVLEDHEVIDLRTMLEREAWNTQTIFPSDKEKDRNFSMMYRLAHQGLLHIHPRFKELISELETFEVSETKGHYLRYSHPKNLHDDYVDSLAWAIRSLATHELNAYELRGVHCHQTGAVGDLCILNGGDQVPLCSSECRSMHNVVQLHSRYKENEQLFPLKLEDFFKLKVVNCGSRVSKR